MVWPPNGSAIKSWLDMDWDDLCFNTSAFIAGLFLLEYGANVFVNNTSIVARRLGISETLVTLLTAGAEWEELAVVVAAILQSKSPLGLGNVIGSSISNILGAFSLGLLFHPGPVIFDRSAKIYTSVLFFVTTTFAVIALTNSLGEAAGIFFIVSFAVYIVSIGYGIYTGVLDAAEGHNSDDDSDEEEARAPPTEVSALLPNGEPNHLKSTVGKRGLPYHILQLVLGFLALSLSGFILSHSASSLAIDLNLSGTVLGMTILSFATTLPEKFLSVISGLRGHGGIVIASTAGSNIFLLTLCLGILFIAGDSDNLGESVVGFEIWTAWACSVILTGIVFLGGRRWMGAILIATYFAFIALEFTVFRR